MSEVSFRIAHLSDLHLAAQAGHVGLLDEASARNKVGMLLAAAIRQDIAHTITSYDRRYLRALSRALAARTKYATIPYDGFIVTGDLATTGAKPDIEQAAKYLGGVAIPGSCDVDNPPFKFPVDRLAVFPGNHDRYAGRYCVPSSVEFEHGAHFGSTWDVPAKKHGDARAEVNSTVFRKAGAKLAVVGADFSYPAQAFPKILYPLKYLGCGRVADHIIDAMVTETKRLQSEECAVLWATHFPPVKSKRTLQLHGFERVVEAAVSCKVNLVLSGHTHQANPSQYPTFGRQLPGVRVISAGSATSAGEKGDRSYYELRLSVHSGVTPGVRLDEVTEMIFVTLPERPWMNGVPGNSAEFCPAW